MKHWFEFDWEVAQILMLRKQSCEICYCPINQVVVRFKPGVSLAKARGLLTEKNLRIVEEPSDSFAGRYIAVFDDIATKGPQLANELASREDLVEYAAAQTLSVNGPRAFY